LGDPAIYLPIIIHAFSPVLLVLVGLMELVPGLVQQLVLPLLLLLLLVPPSARPTTIRPSSYQNTHTYPAPSHCLNNERPLPTCGDTHRKHYSHYYYYFFYFH